MDLFCNDSEDHQSFATQQELEDATTRNDDPFHSPSLSQQLAKSQNEGFEINQHTFYTQESSDDTRTVSSPAARSTTADMDQEAESSSDDDENHGLSLLQKRAKNEQRNQAFLSRIGLEYGMGQMFKRKAPKRKKVHPENATNLSSENTTNQEVQKRGMLLATTSFVKDGARASSSERPLLSEIFHQFPFRQTEISKLTGYLEAGAAQVKNSFVPAPIFVTGPTGVGKTAIVRTCVDWVKRRQNGIQQTTVVLASYVNCSALDEPSIDDLTRNIYRQLAGTLVNNGEYNYAEKSRFIRSVMNENDGMYKTNSNGLHFAK